MQQAELLPGHRRSITLHKPLRNQHDISIRTNVAASAASARSGSDTASLVFVSATAS